jgi:two-component sensor histidine kinase
MIVACLFFGIGYADTLPPPTPLLIGQQVMLQPHFSVREDRMGSLTAVDLLEHPDALVPLDSFRQGSPTSFYWLRTELQTGRIVSDPDRVLSFSNLTYVDIYLYQHDSLLIHKQAGAFRKRIDINESDGRLYAFLPLVPGNTYTLLLKVHHTKHYPPAFDFSLQTKRDYFSKLRFKESMDAALQGAVCLFFVYTLLSWTVTRYKLYLWLLLFIGGIGLYVISSAGYFIEWFFPDDPPAGWLFNIHFLDLGLLGAFLLLRDFWQLKNNYPGYYRWVKWIPALLAVSSLTYFIIDYFTGNYRLTNNIHLWEHPLFLAVVISAIRTCWSGLNPAQRYLAYGLLLIACAGLSVTFNSIFHHERSLAVAPLIGDIAILGVFLLFSTGLKEEMRQHEVDKQAALKELNELQLHQNVILEKKVEERTEELKISNKRLLNQKHQLAERNTKIETLINELNHRVKNNLQLLYSLLSLQLPIVKDGISRDILKGNIGKIRAMMLVNQKLFNFEKGRNIGLCEFITELSTHLQKIYDTKEKTRILQNIPTGIQLSGKHTLSFGLILSELFTNTFKHAFRDHPDPCIRVEAVTLNDHLLQFVYSDNGSGLNENENADKFTMGIPLIKDLTRQMNGQMTIGRDRGLSYSFTIPL